MNADTSASDLIARRGKIIAIHGERMTVRLSADSACGGCGKRASCSPDRVIEVGRVPTLKANDEVDLAVESTSLNLSAMSAYLLPAVTTLTGAQVGALFGGDLTSMGGALIGLVVGLLAHRAISATWLKTELKPLACHHPENHVATSRPGDS